MIAKIESYILAVLLVGVFILGFSVKYLVKTKNEIKDQLNQITTAYEQLKEEKDKSDKSCSKSQEIIEDSHKSENQNKQELDDVLDRLKNTTVQKTEGKESHKALVVKNDDKQNPKAVSGAFSDSTYSLLHEAYCKASNDSSCSTK